MQVREQLRVFLQCGARRAAQRPCVQPAADAGQRVRPDYRDRRVNGTSRTDARGRGRDELGAGMLIGGVLEILLR